MPIDMEDIGNTVSAFIPGVDSPLRGPGDSQGRETVVCWPVSEWDIRGP